MPLVSLREPLGLFDECAKDQIPLWIKNVALSFPFSPISILRMSKHSAASSDEDNSNVKTQSQSQALTTASTTHKAKKSKMDDANEAAAIEAFNKRYKVDSRLDGEVLGVYSLD